MGNVDVISPGQAGTKPILAEVKRHPLALAILAARGLRWWLGEKLVKAPAQSVACSEVPLIFSVSFVCERSCPRHRLPWLSKASAPMASFLLKKRLPMFYVPK
jgi:hypothetical protein